MSAVLAATRISYSRFIKFVLGATVLVWLSTGLLAVLIEPVLGVKPVIPADWFTSLTQLAGVIVGAMVNHMISPTRESEQEIAKLQATAAIAGSAHEPPKPPPARHD